MVFADSPSSAEMLALCERIGLDRADFISLYGEKKIADAILYSKDLKDIYSVLWMWFDLFANK